MQSGGKWQVREDDSESFWRRITTFPFQIDRKIKYFVFLNIWEIEESWIFEIDKRNWVNNENKSLQKISGLKHWIRNWSLLPHPYAYNVIRPPPLLWTFSSIIFLEFVTLFEILVQHLGAIGQLSQSHKKFDHFLLVTVWRS